MPGSGGSRLHALLTTRHGGPRRLGGARGAEPRDAGQRHHPPYLRLVASAHPEALLTAASPPDARQTTCPAPASRASQLQPTARTATSGLDGSGEPPHAQPGSAADSTQHPVELLGEDLADWDGGPRCAGKSFFGTNARQHLNPGLGLVAKAHHVSFGRTVQGRPSVPERT